MIDNARLRSAGGHIVISRAVASPHLEGKGADKAAVFLRFGGAPIGFFVGFFLAAELLQVSQVTPVSNQVLVVFPLAVACAILGWLGAPYATVKPMA